MLLHLEKTPKQKAESLRCNYNSMQGKHKEWFRKKQSTTQLHLDDHSSPTVDLSMSKIDSESLTSSENQSELMSVKLKQIIHPLNQAKLIKLNTQNSLRSINLKDRDYSSNSSRV